MIIATTTEYGTDEDTEVCSRVTRSIIDNYMRRPSLRDQAIQAIASMANNDLVMMRAGEEGFITFDAAFAFIDHNRARFMISGCAAAYYFENGRLVHRSEPEEAPAIGSGTGYRPRLEPDFPLNPGNNAFLTASRQLALRASESDLEKTLKESENAEAWMGKLRALVGEGTHFCAITAFLPNERPSMLDAILRR